MTEQLNILDRNMGTETYAGRIVFSALVASMQGEFGMPKKYNIGEDNVVSVELIVNGHSVPVKATLERYLSMNEKDIAERAYEIAKEMVIGLGLERIAEVMCEAENAIKTEMHNWMSKKGISVNEW